ncbi:MAG TPA: AraC family transcriptional regulator ligand-binding domain-containing protein [Gammaproteobacteria bacterium]|nr:AraC family transcriptional regulator ligand-binding domain-containing protein [Gammaproteobacteria bacterium]
MRPEDFDHVTMPNTYIRLLMQEFADHAAIAEGTGIAPEALADYPHPLTVRQSLRCVANVLPLRPGPDWHLQWGKRMAENFHGAVTVAGLTAPTLGDGLDVFIRYMPDRVPYLDWRSRATGSGFHCEVMPRANLGEIGHMLIEIPLMVMHEYVRVMRSGPLADARLELAYPATEYRERYALYFDCPVDFDRPRNALVIPLAWRAIRNIDFDEAAWRLALARCETAARPRAERDVVERVRRVMSEAIAAAGSGAPPTLDQVAARLHLSSRTIIRRLRAIDSSFQAETERVLKSRATALLADPGNRVQDVAARLGYADAASFRKAFKRWFGAAPGEWREGA